MKVILNTDVPHLGEEGEVKDVKSGYARNFLIPRKLGLPLNNQSMAFIESRRDAIEKRKEEKRKAALGLKERLEAQPLNISMTTGRNGKLFGSVNAASIAGELAKQGLEVERKNIDVPGNSIKSIGNFKVAVKLYGGEAAQLTIAVSSSEVVAEAGKPAVQDSKKPEAAAEPTEAAAEPTEAAAEPTEAAAEPAEAEVTETNEVEGSDQDSDDDE